MEVSVAPQLSEVVGAVQLTAAAQIPASAVCVMSAGVPAMVGFSVSFTVTVKAAVDVLPEGSVAVYVTVVGPLVKVAPGLWLLVSVALQLSCAVGSVHVTAALQLPASMDWVMSVGMPTISGAVTSTMVTVKLAVVVLPAPSVAV